METMEIVIAAFRDLSYVVVHHPVYSVFGCFVISIALLKFYCRLTIGMCDSDQDMTGKTVLITGATSGIGRATAKDLAERNARVILACRNEEKAQNIAEEIISATGNEKVIVKHLDLSSFASVRKCAEHVLNTEEKLHVLINNAGIFSSDKRTTEDGCETVLQSNHLGHFLLTLLLLDLLKKSAPSRIINVASSSYAYGKLDLKDMAGRKCKSHFDLYSRSKLANILFTRELARRLNSSGVTVNALHPGLVKTNIISYSFSLISLTSRLLMNYIGKYPEEGAQTTIYLAVHPKVEKVTGKYFEDCKESKLVGKSLDKALAKELFEVSEKTVGISLLKK